MWLASQRSGFTPEYLLQTVIYHSTFIRGGKLRHVHSISLITAFMRQKQIEHGLEKRKTVVYYANISLLANVSMPLKIASHLADLSLEANCTLSPLLALLFL